MSDAGAHTKEKRIMTTPSAPSAEAPTVEGAPESCEWTNCPQRVGDVCCKDGSPPSATGAPSAWLYRDERGGPWLTFDAGLQANMTPLYAQAQPDSQPVVWQETTADGEPLWDYDNFLSTPEHFDYSRPLYALPSRQWHDIETAPQDEEVLFWIRPKTAEETYHDSYGEPLLMSGKAGPRICKFKCWGILEIATHWMPSPAEPAMPKDSA